ncbi:hypothetical protein ACFL6U_09810 [Planctomycetota bacterium]
MTQNQHHMWPAANTQPTPMSAAPTPKQEQEQVPTEMATRAPMAITTPDSVVADLFGGPAVQIPTDAPLPLLEVMRESQTFRSSSGQLSPEVIGYLLYWHPANTYWRRPFGEVDGARPDCTSSDGIVPDGGEAPLPGPCRDCPKNAYESDPGGGRGKACQNMIRIYFLRDGYRLPEIIKATPASLGKKESLTPWLTNAVNEGIGGKYQTIHVKLDLYKLENRISYLRAYVSILTPSRMIFLKIASNRPRFWLNIAIPKKK